MTVPQADYNAVVARLKSATDELNKAELSKQEAVIKAQASLIADMKISPNSSKNLPVMRPPKYSSNENFLNFIEVFQTFCDATSVDKTNFTPLLLTYLDHTALRKVKGLNLTSLNDYDVCLKAITNVLINETPARSRAKLQAEKQAENEPIQEFINRIRLLADAGYGTENTEIKSQILMDVLLAGTRDKSLAFAIPGDYKDTAENTFVDYCRRAVELENALGLRLEKAMDKVDDAPKFEIF